MAVLKEWRCISPECGREFEGLTSTCPRCGAREATRTFLTPPGINKGVSTSGSAKRIDRMLEREFDKQGITNFSNTRSENKVTWKRRVNASFPVRYNSPTRIGGAPPQQPIQAFIGAQGDF